MSSRNCISDQLQSVENEETLPILDNEYISGLNSDDNISNFVIDVNGRNCIFAALPNIDTTDSLHNNILHSNLNVINSQAPPDSFSFTYLIFYMLGIATMTPWNFFITAEDYWMYKFRNTTINSSTNFISDELTPLQKSFTCDLTLTASVSGTTFLILNAIYGHYVSLNTKIISTLSTIFIIFIATIVFVNVNTDQWQEQFFLITLLTVIIINISSAIMSGSVFGIAALFPSEYMTALVSGQALGGIFTALTLILVLTFGLSPNTTAFVYFFIGSVLILISAIGYIIMTKQPFYIYYLRGGNKYSIDNTNLLESSEINFGVALKPSIRAVLSKIYVPAISIFFLFTSTLSVYPAVSELMQSQNYGNGSSWNDIYYLPVVNYLFFNSGDYFGRILAGIPKEPKKNCHTILLMIFARFFFIPFFLCSNTNLHNFLPILVHSDITFIVMMLTFAISNGYLANCILITAPTYVMQHEKELASSIMAAFLSCGLATGSVLSIVFVQLL